MRSKVCFFLVASLFAVSSFAEETAPPATPKQCYNSLNSSMNKLLNIVTKVATSTNATRLGSFVLDGKAGKQTLSDATGEALKKQGLSLMMTASACLVKCSANKNIELDKICREVQGLLAAEGANLAPIIIKNKGLNGLKRRIEAAYATKKADAPQNYLPQDIPVGDDGTTAI